MLFCQHVYLCTWDPKLVARGCFNFPRQMSHVRGTSHVPATHVSCAGCFMFPRQMFRVRGTSHVPATHVSCARHVSCSRDTCLMCWLSHVSATNFSCARHVSCSRDKCLMAGCHMFPRQMFHVLVVSCFRDKCLMSYEACLKFFPQDTLQACRRRHVLCSRDTCLRLVVQSISSKVK